MIFLIAGASHTGKTVLAQTLLSQYQYPYFSIDLLKMGLIRSGNTHLTPEDDSMLEAYLWPIVREMIQTAIENQQNLIVEGSYIPFSWKDSFAPPYLHHIRYCCLVMSQTYIQRHFDDIKQYACRIEARLDDSQCTLDSVLLDNAHCWEMCQKYGCPAILIDHHYPTDREWQAIFQNQVLDSAFPESSSKEKRNVPLPQRNCRDNR